MRTMWRTPVLCVAMITGLGAFVSVSPVQAGLAGEESASRSVVDRTIKDPDIIESSGLARSRYSRARLWTHNDSGGGPLIYALGEDGRTRAQFRLNDASHRDWEGMAAGRHSGKSYLFIGDIGDNGSSRSSIFVHRVREPRLSTNDHTLNPRTFEFRYPNGAHNAETLMVRPGSLRIYIVTKGKQEPGAIFAAPRHPTTKRVNTLRRIGPAPAGMADGVFLDRQRFLLRGYVSGWLYRSFDATPKRFALPVKGESVTDSWRKRSIYVGSEGRYSKIWRVRLP
jgi:hypothetical protein